MDTSCAVPINGNSLLVLRTKYEFKPKFKELVSMTNGETIAVGNNEGRPLFDYAQ